MSWDSVWEEIFQNRDWGKYPPEELVRFIARNFYSRRERGKVKLLDLGCGPGANVWYLSREGFDTYGIDGSKTAIAKAKARLDHEKLKADFMIGDISSIGSFYESIAFDAVIDIACLQCNIISDIQYVINQVASLLKPGGKFFSMMVSSESYGYGTGLEVEKGTFSEITEGPAKDVGLCHFFTLDEINNLFRESFIINIEYSARSVDGMRHFYKHWIVEGTKRPL